MLSFGSALELIKDLGDATQVSEQYGLGTFKGTHGIGHTRMATESDVDIRSAHPYWAYPYNDIAVVHNGQITNYWIMRREMERLGHRFMSNCDSELLAVYTANNLEQGATLEDSLKSSIKDIDGVFTYLVATAVELGMAKDTMAAKPMVLFESDNLVALASEEVAIRALVPHEIDTSDPYDEEVPLDLFWACRGGGGGNFGIVTHFVLRTHPVGSVVVLLRELAVVGGRGRSCARGRRSRRTRPTRSSRSARSLDRLLGAVAPVFGQYLGGEAQLRALLAPLTRGRGARA